MANQDIALTRAEPIATKGAFVGENPPLSISVCVSQLARTAFCASARGIDISIRTRGSNERGGRMGHGGRNGLHGLRIDRALTSLRQPWRRPKPDTLSLMTRPGRMSWSDETASPWRGATGRSSGAAILPSSTPWEGYQRQILTLRGRAEMVDIGKYPDRVYTKTALTEPVAAEDIAPSETTVFVLQY